MTRGVAGRFGSLFASDSEGGFSAEDRRFDSSSLNSSRSCGGGGAVLSARAPGYLLALCECRANDSVDWRASCVAACRRGPCCTDGYASLGSSEVACSIRSIRKASAKFSEWLFSRCWVSTTYPNRFCLLRFMKVRSASLEPPARRKNRCSAAWRLLMPIASAISRNVIPRLREFRRRPSSMNSISTFASLTSVRPSRISCRVRLIPLGGDANNARKMATSTMKWFASSFLSQYRSPSLE